MKKSLTDRILVLEKKAPYAHIPGTTLSRSISPKDGGGFEWTLGLGGMGLPKVFFTGKTIEDAVKKAEKHFSKTAKEFNLFKGVNCRAKLTNLKQVIEAMSEKS